MFVVREAGSTNRTSELVGTNYRAMLTSNEAFKEVQNTVIESIANSTPQIAAGYSYAYLDTAKSKVALENNFAFHINVGTGEIALAYNSNDGTKNAWIDEIGVNITRAP